MYLRFVTNEIDRDSQRESGIFVIAFKLRDDGGLPDSEAAQLTAILEWFKANLKTPDRFTAAKPPRYRKQKRAISWFKDTAREHIGKIHDLIAILGNHEVTIRMIKTDHPGYVVYEDEHQVVAEPFSDR